MKLIDDKQTLENKRPLWIQFISRNIKAICRIVLIGLFIVTGTISAQAQTIDSIVAISGSMAPYGTNQYIRINSDSLYFQEFEVNAASLTDEYSVVLSSTDLQNIYNKVISEDFFSLTEIHDGGYEDGSGIKIRIATTDGQVKTVLVKNTDVPEINEIVKYINSYLPAGKQLKYANLN